MKRLISLSLLFVIMFFGLNAHAYEEVEKRFFGVGGTVEELKPGLYTVNTKGEKVGEGFVYTPKSVGKEINFQVDLKGKGTVYLKIEETDARGRFIKEQRSSAIELTENWKIYNLDASLDENTEQVDLFVITSSKEKTKFDFRNVKP